jgi:flavin-dependent dehydrogenase
LRLPPHPALTRLIGGAIELHLFDRGYVGLVAQEDGSANLCLAVRKSRLAEADGSPETLLRQIGTGHLGERLAFADWSQPVDAIASVPYGWRATTTEPGVWRLGDQAACIPSLAGEGMGIAVASGIAAARDWLAGKDAPTFQRAFARRTRRPVRLSTLLWQAAENTRFAAAGVRSIAVMPSLAALAARLTRIGD